MDDLNSDPAGQLAAARVNRPHWQPGPLAWAVVTAVSIILLLRHMLDFPVGSEPWWGGLVMVGMAVLAFAFIEGVWLYAQREVAFADGRILVRRWMEMILGRPGVEVPIDPGTRSTITLEGGRRLRIERGDTIVVSMQLMYWPVDTVVELVGAFRSHGAELATPWDGGVPRSRRPG